MLKIPCFKAVVNTDPFLAILFLIHFIFLLFIISFFYINLYALICHTLLYFILLFQFSLLPKVFHFFVTTLHFFSLAICNFAYSCDESKGEMYFFVDGTKNFNLKGIAVCQMSKVKTLIYSDIKYNNFIGKSRTCYQV